MAASLPVCLHTFDEVTCQESGEHVCTTRAAQVCAFFTELLVHTKGDWARKSFLLAGWQREEIVIPLMATMVWDSERKRYVRRYRLAWIELARKNGKSELLAAIGLYMLVADGEEGAEVYGCAADRDQAAKVFDVAERMVELSPTLSEVVVIRRNPKRLIYERRGSWYEPVAADAAGNLGHNPHAILFDEIIAQKNDGLWNAMRTAMGARSQPLMIAATTAGDDPSGFAAKQHSEMVRVADDPDRAPHVFVYVLNTPADADPWDEENWLYANPALDDYLSRSALRDEAIEAKNDPSKENAFRQFRLNQWVQQATRWMPMHRYDACIGEPWLRPDYRRAELAGRVAWGGLDLSARHDLTALFWLVIDPAGEVHDGVWRFWLPEESLRELDHATSGEATVWVKRGWLTLTEGNVIDYEHVYADIETDAKHYRVAAIDYDRWSGEPVRQALKSRIGNAEMVPIDQTYGAMTLPMTELMSLTRREGWAHHGNPVARWCFDSIETRSPVDNPDLIKPVKPARKAGNARIDGAVAAALAVGAWASRVEKKQRLVYGFGG
ncbi:MAG: terminase large subunit [Pseudonocardiales bacterium]